MMWPDPGTVIVVDIFYIGEQTYYGPFLAFVRQAHGDLIDFLCPIPFGGGDGCGWFLDDQDVWCPADPDELTDEQLSLVMRYKLGGGG